MNENPITPVPEPAPTGMEPVPENITLTPTAERYLNQTAPWIRFFSILMFIASGLMMLAAVAIVLVGFIGGFPSQRTLPGAGSLQGGIGVVFLGPFYFLMAIVMYILPAIFLFRYSGAIKALRSVRSAPALEDAMRHQKTFWRYVGVMTCIMLALAILIGIAVAFLAAFLAARAS